MFRNNKRIVTECANIDEILRILCEYFFYISQKSRVNEQYIDRGSRRKVFTHKQVSPGKDYKEEHFVCKGRMSPLQFQGETH